MALVDSRRERERELGARALARERERERESIRLIARVRCSVDGHVAKVEAFGM